MTDVAKSHQMFARQISLFNRVSLSLSLSLSPLTNVLRGIANLVKMARNGSHHTVMVPMSQASVPFGRVTMKSSLVNLLL